MEDVQFFQQQIYFNTFSKKALLKLFENVEKKTFSRGQKLQSEGHSIRYIILVKEGEIKVVSKIIDGDQVNVSNNGAIIGCTSPKTSAQDINTILRGGLQGSNEVTSS